MSGQTISSHRLLIIEALRSAPTDLRRLIKPLPVEALTWQTSEQPSITAVVAQLAMLEPCVYQRFRHIVNADEPLLAVRQMATEAAISGLLDRWQRDRETACAWLMLQTLEAWNRRVTHVVVSTPDDKVSLRAAVQQVIARDTEQLAQVLAIRQAWERQR